MSAVRRTFRPRFGRTDKPPVNTVVKVWYMNCEVQAVWTGERWQTPDGVPLRDEITHWYPR